MSCCSSLCYRINVASSRPKREFKPKPVITTTLEIGDNQQHNGIAYSSSIKSSGESVTTQLTCLWMFCQIFAWGVSCTMRTVDPSGISICASSSRLFPRFQNRVVKQGSSQQTLTHLKSRCGILLGLWGLWIATEGGRRERERHLQKTVHFLQRQMLTVGVFDHSLEYLQVLIFLHILRA